MATVLSWGLCGSGMLMMRDYDERGISMQTSCYDLEVIEGSALKWRIRMMLFGDALPVRMKACIGAVRVNGKTVVCACSVEEASLFVEIPALKTGSGNYDVFGMDYTGREYRIVGGKIRIHDRISAPVELSHSEKESVIHWDVEGEEDIVAEKMQGDVYCPCEDETGSRFGVQMVKHDLVLIEQNRYALRIKVSVNGKFAFCASPTAAVMVAGKVTPCRCELSEEALVVSVPPVRSGRGLYDVCAKINGVEQMLLRGAVIVHERLSAGVSGDPQDLGVNIALVGSEVRVEIYNPAGKKGDTPEIGANGNWWISGVDTYVPAKTDLSNTVKLSELDGLMDEKLVTFTETIELTEEEYKALQQKRESNIYMITPEKKTII